MERTNKTCPSPAKNAQGNVDLPIRAPFAYTCYIFWIAAYLPEGEEPYPSLSDYHDYEPNLEFDDTELHQTPDTIAHTG